MKNEIKASTNPIALALAKVLLKAHIVWYIFAYIACFLNLLADFKNKYVYPRPLRISDLGKFFEVFGSNFINLFKDALLFPFSKPTVYFVYLIFSLLTVTAIVYLYSAGKWIFASGNVIRSRRFIEKDVYIWIFLIFASTIATGGISSFLFAFVVWFAIISFVIYRRWKKDAVKTAVAFINPNQINKAVVIIDISELCKDSYVFKPNEEKYYSDFFKENGFFIMQDALIADYRIYRGNADSIRSIPDKYMVLILDQPLSKFNVSSLEKALPEFTQSFLYQGYNVMFMLRDNSVMENNKLSKVFTENGSLLKQKTVSSCISELFNSFGSVDNYCVNKLNRLFGALRNMIRTDNKLLSLQVDQLLKEYNTERIYHELIQTAEIFIHVCALCLFNSFSAERKPETTIKLLENITLGKMESVIESTIQNTAITDNELADDISFIRTNFLFDNGTKTIKTKLTLSSIVDFRNKYYGHGTLTYSITDELVGHLLGLVRAACDICLQAIESCGINSSDLTGIKLPYCDRIAAVLHGGRIYLFNGTKGSGVDYYDRLNGDFFSIPDKKEVFLSRNRSLLEGGQN